MRLREPFVRKHVHTWIRSKLNCDFMVDWFFDIERLCSDCGKKQHAKLDPTQRAELPDSLIHLGDWSWKEGPL